MVKDIRQGISAVACDMSDNDIYEVPGNRPLIWVHARHTPRSTGVDAMHVANSSPRLTIS